MIQLILIIFNIILFKLYILNNMGKFKTKLIYFVIICLIGINLFTCRDDSDLLIEGKI